MRKYYKHYEQFSSGITFCIPNGYILRYSSLTNQIKITNKRLKGGSSYKKTKVHWTNRKIFVEDGITTETYWEHLDGEARNLTLEITEQCNCRCRYCLYSGAYDNRRVHSPRVMDRKTVQMALNYFYKLNRKADSAHIAFYGGEALLELELIKWSISQCEALFKEKNVTYSISTNGLLLNDSFIKWVACKPQVSIVITLNGPFHDKYRRTIDGQPTLDKILANLCEIKNKYRNVWDSQVKFICNITSLMEVYPLRKFYLDHVGKSPLSITNIVDTHGNDFINTLLHEKYLAYSAMWRKLVVDYMTTGDAFLHVLFRDRLKVIHMRSVFSTRENYIHPFCIPFHDNIFVATDGSINLCERNCRATYGTVENGINIVAVNKIITKVNDEFRRKCAKCWAIRLCSACFANFEDLATDKYYIPLDFCRRERSNILDDLRLYCEMQLYHQEIFERLWDSNGQRM